MLAVAFDGAAPVQPRCSPGAAPAQPFTLTYADKDTDTQWFTQSFSDWAHVNDPRFPGERQAILQIYRNKSTGEKQIGRYAVWEYEIKLDPNKALKSLTPPENDRLVTLAITLLP